MSMKQCTQVIEDPLHATQRRPLATSKKRRQASHSES